MKKTAVIYWSGTGNTEAMANAVLEGMKAAGAEATLLTPDQVDASALSDYDAIAFGCPAMGSEGWGDGEWMRSWEKSCDDANINLFTESVICCEAPDDDALAACTAMGKALAE